MKPFILLLKIQLLGLFGINKTLHADPAKAKRTLALAALVVAAVVPVSYTHLCCSFEFWRYALWCPLRMSSSAISF